jgi:small-conductance mechanosensitive channel
VNYFVNLQPKQSDMKRFITVILILLSTLQIHAVLKEKDLANTLTILRTELTSYYRELTAQQDRRQEMENRIGKQLRSVMLQSNQNALMLYSQQQDYIFDLTYACHEATELYHQFQQQQAPFKMFLNKTNVDVARYDSLIISLNEMPQQILDEKSKKDREACLILATAIRNLLHENGEQLGEFIAYHDATENRLRELNDYAQKRYNDIQTSIFKNGNDSYFSTLMNFSREWRRMTRIVSKKYNPSQQHGSQWDSVFIFGLFISIIVYAIIATLLNQVFFRWLLPKRFQTEEFKKKRRCIIMATTTITFAIIMGVMMATTDQNFFIMASNLLVEYAWLLGVILISLLLRVNGDQINSAFRIYTPLLAIGFIVFAIRIILTPNELVNIIFPPILLICTIWQWIMIGRHNKNIPRSDMFYTYISLGVFIFSTVMSWAGYTLMAVQVLIWWIMQLTCILTITCIRLYLKQYGERHGLDQKPVTQTWFYRLLYQVLLPVTSVASVMLSIYWAADVFNLSDLCWKAFNYKFVDMENLKLSLISMAIVVCLWFFFSYVSKTSLDFLRMHFKHADATTAESRSVMGRNVIQVLVWGAWFIISLTIMDVSSTWIVVISGGLSTGIGFAMKDIIENIYYGITLMAGRIKVGDWIEVDGTMGRVTSINYTSTIVNSLYGEVITFQNSQLFTKNYKNLTRNHGYVLALVPFGVAYGSNVKKVQDVVEKAVTNLHHQWVDNRKAIKVVFTEFADSSVNMKLIVWVDAVKRIYVVSDIMSCIYQTLGDNGIEIPFPQRDIHMK